MRPALGQHFDPALVDPVEDAKLIGPAGMVDAVQAAEFEVREEGRERVALPRPPTAETVCRSCLHLVRG